MKQDEKLHAAITKKMDELEIVTEEKSEADHQQDDT